MEQLNLFEMFFTPKKTEIIIPALKTVAPPQPEPKPLTMLPNDWRKSLALPVLALASVWSAMTEGRNPCRKCNKSVCHDKNACILLSAFFTGLEWKFGEQEGETSTGFAEKGGTYGV